MSDVRTVRISVVPKRSALRTTFNHISFWAVLIGAIGTSKLLFGGSWVIDVIALAMTIAFVASLANRLTGKDAELTHGEIAAWVAAGQPENVKRWKERANG